MAALPNGVHLISGRYGIESGAKRNAARSSRRPFISTLVYSLLSKQEGQQSLFRRPHRILFLTILLYNFYAYKHAKEQEDL